MYWYSYPLQFIASEIKRIIIFVQLKITKRKLNVNFKFM